MFTEEERVVLRDMLDMAIEGFEDAMHRDTEQAPEQDRPQSLEDLLRRSGGFGDTLAILNRIRKKVNSDTGTGGASETI